jgi:uncharacterized protein YjbI with pentapeptide repeats
MVANLERADLSEAHLGKTNFTKADLAAVNLRRADLSGARLTRANLTSANLLEAKFIDSDLIGANFSESSVGSSVFVNSDLSRVMGLESLDHRSPSHISINTFVLSKGQIPEIFLRGCGLSDADIEYTKLSNPGLSAEEINKILHKIQELRAAQALQISPLFISYSQADSRFVDKVGNHLTKQGIRFWRDTHDAKARKTERQIDHATYQSGRVVLVLSEKSLSSNWTEPQIRAASGLEKELGRKILYPIALDDSWKDNHWSKGFIEQIRVDNVRDFSAWRSDSQFDGILRTLIDGLELFYKG